MLVDAINLSPLRGVDHGVVEFNHKGNAGSGGKILEWYNASLHAMLQSGVNLHNSPQRTINAIIIKRAIKNIPDSRAHRRERLIAPTDL